MHTRGIQVRGRESSMYHHNVRTHTFRSRKGGKMCLRRGLRGEGNFVLHETVVEYLNLKRSRIIIDL
jgi:hypothetical protein